MRITTPFADNLRVSRSARSAVLPWLIPAAVLLVSALVALRAPGGLVALLLLAAGPVALGAVLLLRRPGLGPVVLVTAGLLVPWTIGTGTGTTLNPVILLVPALTGLWLLDMVARRRSVRLHHHPAVYAALLMCVVVVLAFIAGQLPWFDIPGAGLASQLGGLFVFLISAAAFLVSAHVLNERWLRRLVAVFLAIAGLYMVARLVPPLGAFARLLAGGAIGSVFWIWAVALGGGIALFGRGLLPGVRVAAAGVAGLTLTVALVQGTAWASGWAPAGMALLLLVWLRFPRLGWVPLLLAIFGFLIQQEIVWSAATNTQSWVARQQAWQLVLDAAKANPILGLGPSNYYFYVQQYDIGGWGEVWNVSFNSHNNWVDLIAQTGILGLLTVLWFAAAMGRTGWQRYRRLPDGFPRAYAAACLAGLVATLASGMLGDWFLPFVYNIGLAGMRSSILFWVFMGGLLSLNLQFCSESGTRSQRR
jgi:O-antigen ligase